MKVGIITFHRGANYGGTLQALALQVAVKQLGHEPEIIDYWPIRRRLPPVWRGWNTGEGFSGVLKRLLQIHHGDACLKAFESFREQYLKTSPPVHSLDDLNVLVSRYDAIITGSDQVWNFRRSPAYFLDFDERFKGRRISYAACCTQEEQPDEKIQVVGGYIRNFDHVSVRDVFSAKAVHNASGRMPEIVCDPTLLMTPDWMVSNPHQPSSRNLVVYHIGKPMAQMKRVVERIKQFSGCVNSMGIVASTSNPHFSKETDGAFFRLPPQEWVDKIHSAGFLLTDSYHGVLFALRMRTPFLAFAAESGRSPRMKDLGERFGFANRIISNPASIDSMDWETISKPAVINESTKQHIDQSWRFLERSLA